MAHADRDLRSLQMKNVEAVKVPVDAAAAAKRLSKAVTFPTISNQDRSDFDEKAFHEFHQYLANTFPLVHKKLKREVLGAPRAFSLLYTWEGKNPSLPPVVLMGHLDVVPVVPGTEKDWQHGPFSGDIADGYVWGRGTLDDKVMVLAILEAVELHLARGFQPTRTLHLVFGQDEEVMGLEGARHVADVLKSRGVNEVALVLDEGLPLATGLFPGIPNAIALIGIAEKGYATLQLNVEGPGGHSAMPPRNSNIGILDQAITRLEANPFPYRISQAVRDQFRFLGPELPAQYHAVLADIAFGGQAKAAKGPPRQEQGTKQEHASCPTAGWGVARDSEDQFIRYMLSGPQTTSMLHTTTAVTVINGGVKENVLPPIATALVNFRILQGETVKSVAAHVTKVINDERVAVTVLEGQFDPSPVSDPDGSEYKLLEKSIRQTWGEPDLLVSPYLVIGGTDSKYLAATIAKNVYRFSAVRVESAADTARWHGVNERVLVSEYARSIGFFHNFIANAEAL